MRIVVDTDLCESHGQCVFVAPEVFTFDADDHLLYEPTAADNLLDRVANAATACPARAITLLDDEPAADPVEPQSR